MAIYEIKTFADIYGAVREELKVQSGDTNSIARIKRNVNQVYLQEVVPFRRWPWLTKSIDLSLPPYVETGTAAVTEESQTVTLSSAPATSKQGHWFSVKGSNRRYRIYSHAAASTTLVLEAPYEDATDATATYQIWTDALPLPADCRETVEVTRDGAADPLMGVGFQEFKRIVNADPKREEKPSFYHTAEALDPAPYTTISGLPATSTRSSAGLVRTVVFASTVAAYLTQGERIRITGAGAAGYNGEFVVSSVSTTTVTFTATTALVESSTSDTGMTVTKLSQESSDESSRRLMVHPSMQDTYSTLHVDYVRKVYPLESDSDEPVMPLEDRVLLVYGALALSWDRERNGEASNKNELKFREKLSKMAARFEDSTDFARLKPSSLYLAAKRSGNRRGNRGSWGE